jgi:hypothetical protein
MSGKIELIVFRRANRVIITENGVAAPLLLQQGGFSWVGAATSEG